MVAHIPADICRQTDVHSLSQTTTLTYRNDIPSWLCTHRQRIEEETSTSGEEEEGEEVAGEEEEEEVAGEEE